ncbi:hypothetical protein BDV93DRAFT_551902 [Ceratobasidium sp. AG-I]|nr:hypothetical protein BDV93DRAFT_551902 [Ceratobasidium sp. AG-I]
MDLDRWGAGHNGNHIHAYPQDHWVPHKRWRFERLSDDTGEDGWQLRKEVDQKNKQLAELADRLAKKDEELARIQQELSEKSALLEKTRNAPRRPTGLLKSRELEPEVKEDNVTAELSQQRRETASLREKMGIFERLKSQVIDSGIKRPNNMT